MDIINVNTYRRNFAFHGAIVSADFNEILEEIVLDFTSIAQNLNGSVQPIIESLPQGSRTITAADRNDQIDPITNGLDGTQMFLDMTANDPNNPLLFNSIANRPNTIAEALQYLLFRIEQITQSS